MDKTYLDDLIPDFGDYSPDAIWETTVPKTTAQPEPDTKDTSSPPLKDESLAERSRREAMDAFGKALRQYQNSDDTAPPPQPQEVEMPAATGVLNNNTQDPPVSAPQEPKKEEETPRRPRITRGEDGIITITYDMPAEEPEPEADASQPDEAEAPGEAAPPEEEDFFAGEPAEETAKKPRRPEREREEDPLTFKEKLLRPVMVLSATFLARREMQRIEAAKWPDPEEEPQPPELSPKKAAKFYGSQVKPLRLRSRIALFLTVVLAWIAFGLPMAGLLGKSVAAQAGVSLILTLAVMVTALDVVTAGFRQLFDLRPGAEALATLSALFACIDAALVRAGHGAWLPFCAAASLSLTAALWGQRLTCSALRRTFKVAGSTKDLSILVSDESPNDGEFLRRTSHSGQSIVRRSEQPDIAQTTYTAAAPILLGLSLVLSILASLNGKGNMFLHIFSALLTVSAALSAFFAFPLPYALSARRLLEFGAGILGWGGISEIGRIRHVVVSDEDLFPAGTVRFSAIHIQEGAFVSQVVSYTASLLAAAGSSVTPVFEELMTMRNYPMSQVDSYACHESSGFSAVIDGRNVLVGSAKFISYMNVDLPSNLDAKNSICTAIDGELVGVFVLAYTPVTSVQDALVTLLRGRTRALFAVRDFNITRLTLRQMFRIPTDNLNFPSFRECYRITGTVPKSSAPASAVFARSGMMNVVDVAETARRIHGACRISTIISLAGTILGMLILFLLFRTGTFDTATAGNVLAYMLLWALPVIILSIGQSR